MIVKVLAKTAIFDQTGKILILRRSLSDHHWPGSWDFPGGNLDPGEDAEAAAIREAREEANLSIRHPQLATLRSITYENDAYITYLIFYSTDFSGNIKLSDEHSDFQWVTFDELRRTNIPKIYVESAEKAAKLIGQQ